MQGQGARVGEMRYREEMGRYWEQRIQIIELFKCGVTNGPVVMETISDYYDISGEHGI